MRVAHVLGREGEQGLQQVLPVFVQQSGTPAAFLVPERSGLVVVGVRLDPVVDALPGYAEHTRQLGRRAPAVELQHGERAPQDAGIHGLRQLTPETPPLPNSEVEPAHVLLLQRGSLS